MPLRYSGIIPFDVSNGNGIGVALFVQGCHFHCKNCFNQCTWDFNGGKDWTDKVQAKLFNYLDKFYVDRFSVLGGEPLADENISGVENLCKEVRKEYPNIKIWLYTGNKFEDVKSYSIMNYIDYLVDGRYVDEERDLSLKFRGSRNQNIYCKKDGVWILDA